MKKSTISLLTISFFACGSLIVSTKTGGTMEISDDINQSTTSEIINSSSSVSVQNKTDSKSSTESTTEPTTEPVTNSSGDTQTNIKETESSSTDSYMSTNESASSSSESKKIINEENQHEMGAAIPSNRSVTQKLTPNSMYPDSDFIDVSSNNNYISVADYKAMKRAGIGGVVVKLTEYETYKNPLASSQISNAISAGLKVSAYHYSWFGDIASAKSEANYFAAYAKYLGLPANTLMVNDFESETCLKSSDGTNLSKVFSNQLKANGYGRVLHYSSGSVFENGKLNQSALLPDLIWTAGYPSNPSSSNLRYTSSAAWQWNDNMSFPGVNGAYDISMDYKNLFVNPTTTVVEPADTLDNFTGDWNGDGKDSIMLNLKNSYYVKDSFNTNGADYKFIYGNTGDYAIVGDWDGNGTDTLSIRRENIYFISNSNTSGIAQREIKYGNSNDEIFVGDWDGDGKDTLAIRRENVFYFKDSMQSGIADRVITYGNSGDKVLIGDWDGDGKDTLAVHRGDKFYIKNGITTGKADITFTYGNPNGDSAVAGDWDGDSIDTFAIKRGDTYYLNNKFYGGRAEQTVLLDPNIICK